MGARRSYHLGAPSVCALLQTKCRRFQGWLSPDVWSVSCQAMVGKDDTLNLNTAITLALFQDMGWSAHCGLRTCSPLPHCRMPVSQVLSHLWCSQPRHSALQVCVQLLTGPEQPLGQEQRLLILHGQMRHQRGSHCSPLLCSSPACHSSHTFCADLWSQSRFRFRTSHSMAFGEIWAG